MRVAAAGVLAIIAAIVLAAHGAASADESSPFPSPSPSSSAGPGQGGYALVGIDGLAGSGGQIPPSLASPSPAPFRAAGATGYSIEIMGRMSPAYLALLHYEDVNVHGDDAAVESRFDVSALRQFSSGRAAFGLGFVALQRSTATSTSNGLGLGVALLPDLSRGVSVYGSAFVYPSLPSGTVRGALSVLRLGLTIAPARATGVFARVGVTSQNFAATTFSPKSLTGVELGIGTSF